MGKPYRKELEALAQTYEWARWLPIEPVNQIIEFIKTRPLLAVGSGGSYSAATFAAALHENFTGHLSRAATPMDVASVPNLRESAVLFLSAGGTNVDIRGALTSVIASEPGAFAIFSFARLSPLSREARRYNSVSVLDLDLPSGKDGFLSVNSLLAFCVLLLRGYAQTSDLLPSAWDKILSPKLATETFEAEVAPIWKKRFILLVYSCDVRPAAVDMESKFSEAALGAVQLTDIRNFGHGRHNWVSKYPEDTAVVFLVSDLYSKAAQRTKRLLPSNTFSVIVTAQGTGLVAALSALISVFYMTKYAGDVKQIDPGRPGVPDFGGRIYSLNVWRASRQSRKELLKTVAVDRKISVLFPGVNQVNRLPWEDAYSQFLGRLSTVTFGALICDYDGTLSDHRDRYGAASESVTAALNTVLATGCYVGIATGRGSSVRDALRQKIDPKFQERVFIGYHNSAEIAPLSLSLPDSEAASLTGNLKIANDLLASAPIIDMLSTRHYGMNQIGLRARSGFDINTLHRAVLDELSGILQDGIQCLMSSHSVDVLPSSIAKTKMISHMQSLGVEANLAIGDLGQWPGNDCALLRSPYSLSSDSVSAHLATCWNLAPPSVRNVHATLFYLNSIRKGRDSFSLDIGRLTGESDAD